jgi:putative oxidoreductase
MSAWKAKLEEFRRWVDQTAKRLDWLPPLLTRLTVGVVFMQSGWGKLHSLDKVTGFFTSLGLPAPAFQAQFVSLTEFVGGALVLVGLLSRFAAVPLMVTMVVAIVTAKVDELKSFGDLFGFTEYCYLVLLAWIAVRGGGAVSLDTLAARALKLAAPSTEPAKGPGRLAALGVAAAAAVGLGGLTLWAVAASHNPCDRLGAGEFTDVVQTSRSGGDGADMAWQTCKQILQWKKEGKDPHVELKKQEEPEPEGG